MITEHTWQLILELIAAIMSYHVVRVVPKPKLPKSKLPLPKRKPKLPEYMTVWDAVQLKNVPRIAASSDNAIAVYMDGRFQNVAEGHQLFPHDKFVTIATQNGSKATYVDCEPGNLGENYRAIAIAMWENGDVEGIYADQNNWTAIMPIVKSAEFRLHRKCKKWLSAPTGKPHLPAGYDGCQYAFDDTFDKSLVKTSTFF